MVGYCLGSRSERRYARRPTLILHIDGFAGLVYGRVFRGHVTAMGIRDRPTSLGSPWQNRIAERLIGALRRECRDHIIVFGERHLLRALSAYAAYSS